MAAREIDSHQFDIEEPERALRSRERRLPVSLDHLAKVPDNLGASFDGALKILGLRRALGHPDEQLVDALRLVCDLGVALFQRAMVSRESTLVLSIGGKQYEVKGASSYYNSAPRWGLAAGAAMTLRDQQALTSLCAFDVQNWGGSYDRYHELYAEAVMAFVAGRDDCEQRLSDAAAAADDAQLMPERGRRLGVPLIHLAQAVVARDAAAFNAMLEAGLTWYRTLYSRSPDNQDATGVVPLRYLGWAARAHDLGLRCEVRSDYLPTSLVEGTFSEQ